MRNILWLASWYPHNQQPLSGDFIERHAKSASAYNKITVLYSIKTNRHEKSFTDKIQYNENCSAFIFYYKPISRIPVIESIIAPVRYCLFMARMIAEYVQNNGKPDLIHVQVCWRAGLLAVYCKWKYRLKYVITEHWSAFMPEAKPAYEKMGVLQRQLTKLVYRHASGCSAVSVALAAVLAHRFSIPKPIVIPNVVDTGLFFPSAKKKNTFRFIHISDLNYQKNPEQLFEAIGLLKKTSTQPFEFILFVPEEEQVKLLSEKYQVQDRVFFKKQQPQALLARELALSDALVLYSRFETFGCVVIEALASGVPVIVSDIPVLREIVVENDTGYFVPPNNPVALSACMKKMMQQHSSFQSVQLSDRAVRLYSFERIGKMFDNWYAGQDVF